MSFIWLQIQYTCFGKETGGLSAHIYRIAGEIIASIISQITMMKADHRIYPNIFNGYSLLFINGSRIKIPVYPVYKSSRLSSISKTQSRFAHNHQLEGLPLNLSEKAINSINIYPAIAVIFFH